MSASPKRTPVNRLGRRLLRGGASKGSAGRSRVSASSSGCVRASKTRSIRYANSSSVSRPLIACRRRRATVWSRSRSEARRAGVSSLKAAAVCTAAGLWSQARKGGGDAPRSSAASRLALQTRRSGRASSRAVQTPCSQLGSRADEDSPSERRLNLRRGSLQLEHRHLVEIRGLDGQADRRGELLAPLGERLLGLLRRVLALPQQDRSGSAVLRVVQREVALEAVVLAQHRNDGAANRLDRVLPLLGIGTRERDEPGVHVRPPSDRLGRSYDDALC